MIRGASLGDIETLAGLHRQCFAEVWGAQEFARLLAVPGTFALLAPDDAGFVLARVAADEAEILSIGVRPQNRCRGMGRALMEAVANEAFQRGAKSLYLEVSCNNGGARALYAKLGFAEAGRRVAYYREKEGMADALTLKAALPLMLGKAAGLD
jgi:ribosomal-protein-alanine N-acetyltransferase